MTTPPRHVYGLTRADLDGQLAWAWVGEGSLAALASDRITAREWETLPSDRHRVSARGTRVVQPLPYGAAEQPDWSWWCRG